MRIWCNVSVRDAAVMTFSAETIRMPRLDGPVRSTEERLRDAEDLDQLGAWRSSFCGCEHHDGNCLGFLFNAVGMGPLIKRRRARREAEYGNMLTNLVNDLDPALELTEQAAIGKRPKLRATLSMKVHCHKVCLPAWCQRHRHAA